MNYYIENWDFLADLVKDINLCAVRVSLTDGESEEPDNGDEVEGEREAEEGGEEEDGGEEGEGGEGENETERDELDGLPDDAIVARAGEGDEVQNGYVELEGGQTGGYREVDAEKVGGGEVAGEQAGGGEVEGEQTGGGVRGV